jgi:hypothetical protein
MIARDNLNLLLRGTRVDVRGRIRFAASFVMIAFVLIAGYRSATRGNRARLESEYYLLEPPVSMEHLQKNPLAEGDTKAPLSNWWLYQCYASREDCARFKMKRGSRRIIRAIKDQRGFRAQTRRAKARGRVRAQYPDATSKRVRIIMAIFKKHFLTSTWQGIRRSHSVARALVPAA